MRCRNSWPISFAESHHRLVNQARKGTTFPYLVHPLRVAAILDRFGCNEDAVVAGFLHDTVEDACATYDEIAAIFWSQVAQLVERASEPDKSLSWDMRKQHTIERAKSEEDGDALDLIAADKLDNIRSLRETIEVRGHRTTAPFDRGERALSSTWARAVVER